MVVTTLRLSVLGLGTWLVLRGHLTLGTHQREEVGGRGIWLAYALCDEVTMATGPIGTTIELCLRLPGRDTTSGLLNEGATAG